MDLARTDLIEKKKLEAPVFCQFCATCAVEQNCSAQRQNAMSAGQSRQGHANEGSMSSVP
eukprot:6166626-Amphidinium_carterae.1